MAARVDSANRERDVTQLESWSRQMIDAINARDFTNPVFALATSNFEAGAIDVFPPTTTPAAHLDKFRKMAEENPEYHMHVDDIRTDVVGGNGGLWAKVYVTARASGRPAGLTREALGVLTWRKDEKDGWRLTSHESMRTFVV